MHLTKISARADPNPIGRGIRVKEHFTGQVASPFFSHFLHSI